MFKTFCKDLFFRPYVFKLNVQRILEMRKSPEQLKTNRSAVNPLGCKGKKEKSF